MKKLVLYVLLLLIPVLTKAQGMPVVRNFTAEEYGAHNRNFDIAIGEDGTVYVANFEGLLYYDRAQWRILYTPSINRITVVYKAKDNVIWVGGYNYFGHLHHQSNGQLYLQQIGKPDAFHGEVLEIYEDQGKVMFLTSDQQLFEVDGQAVKFTETTDYVSVSSSRSDIVDVEKFKQGKGVSVVNDVTQTLSLDNGVQVQVRVNQGLLFTDKTGRVLYSLTEDHGLCSNSVSWVEYDGHGLLWGATDHGIFAVEVPSPYSQFLPSEGLTGEVHSIIKWKGQLYVGTNSGLFRLEGNRFVAIAGIDLSCWKLLECQQGLLVATSNGVWLIAPGGAVRQLTTGLSLEIMQDGQDLYIGQQDGVMLYRQGLPLKKICDVEQVTKILKDGEGSIWLQNIYGEVYRKLSGETTFTPYATESAEKMAATLVPVGGKVEVISAIATKPFHFPTFSTIDENGATWLTDNAGKHLYQWKDGKRITGWDKLLFPYSDMTVSALYNHEQMIWIGGDNILTVIDTGKQHLTQLSENPRLLFRSIVMGADSVLWGGYGQQPKQLPKLSSDERNLRFAYALDFAPLVGTTLYRYRLNNDNWSAWSENCDAVFLNLPSGDYTLAIQARLSNGKLSDEVTVQFGIAYPVFMRWYMICLYALLLCLLVWAFFRRRLKKLNEDKLKLEKIVQERTSEVVKQKDEIEEKSKSLEKALDDLSNAQHELIRQEKMATVGKLTQGLIDRILNPLNYINNFSKLSEGLVKDIEANIEDEKDKMDEENYEDTKDVLDMLLGNLQKVSEHGQNTTRTLKAMEEMLKDRTGGYQEMDLVPILKQDEEMVRTYYADDIAKYHINVGFSIPEGRIMLQGNPELLSKTLMSMLGNAVYAIVKKAQRSLFDARLTLTVTLADRNISMKLRDNGIGIEETIIDKIFDPFFTTKTTGEAAGVGLYLSREIIQNHGGDISVESVKNEFSEFTILLPRLKNEE